MFDGVADASNYQINMFLGEKYIRLQTILATASDDFDNAANGNNENHKTEATKLIRTRKSELEEVCQLFVSDQRRNP
jgi:uncharacterized protein